MTTHEKEPTNAGRRRFRALVKLSRQRLARSGMAKAGRFFVWVIAVALFALTASVRVSDGSVADVEGLVATAARLSAWLGAGFIAMAAAEKRTLAERRDGIEHLMLARGASLSAMRAARIVASSLETFRAIVLPTAIVGVATIVVSPTVGALAARVTLLAFAILFAALTAIVLSVVAAFADEVRPSGGRGIFLAVLLLPWAALDLVGRGSFSLPGALGSVLQAGTELVGAHAPFVDWSLRSLL